MNSYKKDYCQALQNVTNQLDSLMYELENFSENSLKIPSEFKHDAYPIIRRLKEAKRLTDESIFNYSEKKS